MAAMNSRNARIIAYAVLVLAGAVMLLNPSQIIGLFGLVLAVTAFVCFLIESQRSFRDK